MHGALVAPVLGQQHDSRGHRVAGAADAHGAALDDHPARRGAVGAEDQPDELRAPGADETRDAEDVSCADREARVLDDAGPAEALDPEDLLAGSVSVSGGLQRSTVTAALLPVMCSISWLRSTSAVGASKTILPSRMTATSSVRS